MRGTKRWSTGIYILGSMEQRTWRRERNGGQGRDTIDGRARCRIAPLVGPPAPLSVSSPDVDMMRQSTQRAETSGAWRMPAGMGRHNRARKACRVG